MVKDSLLDSGRGSIMSKDGPRGKDRIRLKAVVDWVCLNVFIFTAILLNYIYSTLLHDLTTAATSNVIAILDKAGFEAHFVRFIHMTLFAQDGVSDKDTSHTVA